MFVLGNIFGPLITVFADILTFFHDSLGVSWGWSIILLTACVRGVMMPLAFKQYQSMRRLQVHQPEMKAIQKRYKGDKQRQQQEMMKFYKENNVNPLSSCLPMVLQLPVFVALFYMLEDNLRKDICPLTQRAYAHSYAIAHGISAAAAAGKTTACGAVHGAGFLFIPDITDKAHGLVLIVLLVLYVGTQMVSTLIMAGPTMDGSQRKMMLIMPVVFVIFIIRFPAGLIVYWVTSNGWTMGQQFVLKQFLPAPPPPEPAVGGGTDDESSEGLGSQLRELVGKFAGTGSSSSARSNGGGARVRSPNAPPPPPPRKKKKRSGRRR